MRARNIKPGFFKSSQLGKVNHSERLLFIGLWCFADKEGFFSNDYEKILVEIFPYDRKITTENIKKMLCNLITCNLITSTKTHGYIPKFVEHQHPHPNEAKSTVLDEVKKTLINLCNDISGNFRELQADIINTDILNTDIRNTDCKNSLRPANDAGSLFSQFWSHYPSRNGKKVGKAEALKVWQTLKLDQHQALILMGALESQIQHKHQCDLQKVFCAEFPDAHRWLKRKDWEAEIQTADELRRAQRKIAEDEYARSHSI